MVAAAVLLAVAVVVAGRVAHSVEGVLPQHAARERTSPDGHWSLVIDSVTNTLDDDTTTVYLRPRPDDGTGPGTTLYEGDWQLGSGARWRDARTVSIAGALQMPFVEHAIDTGSARTTGTDLDAEGYARNEIAPGERVEMLSGLSMVLPGSRPGELLTQRAGLAGREWQTLVERIDPATPSFGPYALAALSARSEFMSWGVLEKDGRLLGRSGGVEVWWAPTPHWIVVVTQLPHRMIGLVWKQQASATSSSAARTEAERMWRRFAVRGASLPWP